METIATTGKPQSMETTDDGILWACDVFVKNKKLSVATAHGKTRQEALVFAKGIAHCVNMYPVTFGL